MYLVGKGNKLASFYDFSMESCTPSDSVVFFFHFFTQTISSCRLKGSISFNWYDRATFSCNEHQPTTPNKIQLSRSWYKLLFTCNDRSTLYAIVIIAQFKGRRTFLSYMYNASGRSQYRRCYTPLYIYNITRVCCRQGYRGCDQMVNGFTTTHVTSAYHH